MKKILLLSAFFGLPFLSEGQSQSFFCSLGVGYTLPNGDHHSDYSSTLINRGTYTGEKKFTYSGAAKLGYRYGGFGAGIALETGIFQTQKDVTVSPITLLNLDGTLYVSGKYWMPQVFAQYRIRVWKGIYVEPGISAGAFMTSASGGEGIGVFSLPSQLGSLSFLLGTGIPSRFGVQTIAGATGQSGSTKFLMGAQLAAGCRIGKHWSAWGEAAYRSSKMDAHLDVLNLTTVNTALPLRCLALRAGVSFEWAYRTAEGVAETK